MQKRINKPKWAPTTYTKPISALEPLGPKESYKFQRAYIDEDGLTLVYQKESDNPAWRYKHYFSASVYFTTAIELQGITLSRILETEIENGYTENADRLRERNNFKTNEALINRLREGEKCRTK